MSGITLNNKNVTSNEQDYGKALSSRLLPWYIENHRKLPWRETKDPYKIWVSEIMLQQTQVDTVLSYYNKFIQELPNVKALAEIDEDSLLNLWKGLGYYSRAKRMRLAAIYIMQNFGGIFPTTHKNILQLPGIGDYTAGAIASFAYNIKKAAVDGNVLRVVSRLKGIYDDIGEQKTKKNVTKVVEEWLPEEVDTFNQGMMELGAMVCKPNKPLCHQCPLNSICYANANALQDVLPIKEKRTKQNRQKMAVAFVHYNNKRLIIKRREEGLLASLWGFPIVQVESKDNAIEKVSQYLQEEFGIEPIFEKKGKSAKHVFSHLIWDMEVYHYTIDTFTPIQYPKITFVDDHEILNYPLPAAFSKLL